MLTASWWKAAASRLRRRPRADVLTGWSAREAAIMLRAPGCPLCARLEEDADRAWWWFYIETYHAPEVVAEFIRAGGFCARHARRAVEEAPRYVVSHLYALLAQAVETALDGRRRWPIGDGPCPLCRIEGQSEAIAAHHLVQGLRDPQVAAAYGRHAPLCLRHLGLVMRLAPPDVAATLAAGVRSWLREVAGDLREYFRKVDFRFAHEPKGPEQMAWYRMLSWATGARLPAPRDAAPDVRA